MNRIARTLTLALVIGSLAVPAAFADERGNGNPPDRGQQDQRHAIRVMAEYLGLSDAQVASWGAIFEAEHEAAKPIAEALRANEQALRELLNSASPDAAAVGTLVIEGKSLREQLRALHDSTGDQLVATLDEAQKAKLAKLEGAGEVCRVIPAAHALGLI